MSTAEVRTDTSSPTVINEVDFKFEVVVIPVSDVDRAKQFYSNLGWRLDADFPFDNGFRVVQFTPPGSGFSVQFGAKMTTAVPGSAQGLYLIVSDIVAARGRRARLAGDIGDGSHEEPPGARFETDGSRGGVPGGERSHKSYS